MNGLPYYKAYPRDFIEGTVGMPFEIKAAYRLVLDLIYMQGGRLPDDARYIAGLLGVSVRRWTGMRDELIERGKITVNGEFLTNYRAEKELETLRSFADKQAERASGPKKNKSLEKPRPNHTEPEPDKERKKPPHTPRKRGDESDPDGFADFWAAYPRKVAKGAARKAYAKALAKAASPAINAAARTVPDDGRYTPHPATWLNGERWLDPPPPLRAVDGGAAREETWGERMDRLGIG